MKCKTLGLLSVPNSFPRRALGVRLYFTRPFDCSTKQNKPTVDIFQANGERFRMEPSAFKCKRLTQNSSRLRTARYPCQSFLVDQHLVTPRTSFLYRKRSLRGKRSINPLGERKEELPKSAFVSPVASFAKISVINRPFANPTGNYGLTVFLVPCPSARTGTPVQEESTAELKSLKYDIEQNVKK